MPMIHSCSCSRFARRFAVVACLLGSIALIAPAHAQMLVYCSEGSPEGFNPALYTSATTFDATRQIFDQLTELDPVTLDIEPALAESWEVSDDGRTYTFHLRQGVAFQSNFGFTPSRPFDADDVLFSFERQLDADHPYHRVSGGQYTVFYAMDLPTLIENIEKLDDHTIRFRLSRADASFLATLAMDFASIQSAEYADALLQAGRPDRLDHDPVGTGPFVLADYRIDTSIRYRAFEQHWRGKPQIETLVFSITLDPSVRYFKLRANECQLIAYPNPADLQRIERDPNITLQVWDGFNIGYLAFNTDKTPFQDVRVRQALTYAIDKANIIDVVYAGTAKAAKSPIPVVSWAHDAKLKAIPYDPDEARRLLSEAGYPNGFSTDIWAMPVQRPYNPNAQRMAELIQADWAKVGVQARIVTYEWGEYLRRSKRGEHETLLLGWSGQNGDPDNFLSPLLSCNAKHVSALNRAQWCNTAFDELLEAGRMEIDHAARKPYYDQAQEIFLEQAPWVAIAHAHVIEAVRTNVLNYRSSPFGRHLFYAVSLAADGD